MANLNEYDMQYAVNGIHRFFDVYRLPIAIAYIEGILEAATLPKVWRHDVPANLVCFMENMEQLFTAAYILHNNHAVNNVAMTGADEAGVPGITARTSVNGHRNDAWEYFPRSLTLSQYSNPYEAISQCCSYMQEAGWKQLLQDITECALSNTTLYEMLPHCNILRVRRYLLRLLEACHLIGLRWHANKETNKRPVRERPVKKK